MPFALVKEDGTGLIASANSYADLTDAASYHDANILGSAWTSAGGTGAEGDAAKAVALVQATRTLDNLCAWPGTPAVLNQPLGWPRAGAWRDNRLFASVGVPMAVIFATCELARILLVAGDPTQEPADDGTVSVDTIGPITTEYRAPAGFGDKGAQLDQVLPRSVIALLRPILGNLGRTGGARFASVVRV